MKKHFRLICFIYLLSFILLCSSALSAPINEVPYASLTGTQLITFDDVSGGFPGTNYDNIFESGNTAFGEHFLGQTVSDSSGFDVISGLPSGGGLTLVAGATNQNLYVVDSSFGSGPPGSNAMAGLGPLGYPNDDAAGEGAFSLLFDYDQSQFGIQVLGGFDGNAYIDFFARDGSLIDGITLIDIFDDGEVYYGFERDVGIMDIAGITLWNDDPLGLGFDNILFDVAGVPGDPNAVVPEPSTFVLLGGGLAGLALFARRRKKE